MLQLYQMNQKYAADKPTKQKEMLLQYTESSLTERSAQLIALLVLNDRKTEAEKIAARIKKEAPSAARDAAIDAALQGKFPKTD